MNLRWQFWVNLEFDLAYWDETWKSELWLLRSVTKVVMLLDVRGRPPQSLNLR
jgi:hypothetical protein